MATIIDYLRSLRAERRTTVRSLSGLDDSRLTVHVGPGRSADVRATILSLAEEDDRRCATLLELVPSGDWLPTDGQRILAGLARTRGYLRGALVGVPDGQLDAEPAPGEWSVRQALRHLINNERRFVADATYAVDRQHSSRDLPVERADPDRGPGTLGPPLPGDLEEVLTALEQTRDDVFTVAASLTTEDLSAETTWGGQTVDIRFMLRRRATHERQHTVQIEKALRAIGCHHTEVQMLLAQAEIARGALESLLTGLPDEWLHSEFVSPRPTIQWSEAGERGWTPEQFIGQARPEEHETVAAILRAVG